MATPMRQATADLPAYAVAQGGQDPRGPSRTRQEPSTTPNRQPAYHHTSMAANLDRTAKKPSPERTSWKQSFGRAAPKPPRNRSLTPTLGPEVLQARATSPMTSLLRKSRRPLPRKPPGKGDTLNPARGEAEAQTKNSASADSIEMPAPAPNKQATGPTLT